MSEQFAKVVVHVNASISAFAERRTYDRAESWLFFCECGELGCFEQVVLTRDDYDALREVGEPILAPGHQLPARARRNRQEA